MRLTRREEQVLSLIASGMKNAEIATCMGLSVRTVHAHLANIYLKMGVTNRSAALMEFLKNRIAVELKLVEEKNVK